MYSSLLCMLSDDLCRGGGLWHGCACYKTICVGMSNQFQLYSCECYQTICVEVGEGMVVHVIRRSVWGMRIQFQLWLFLFYFPI